ncbi:MAG: L-histidine N(alpha)-methyltransferase [Bryobacteraceae bacterium]
MMLATTPRQESSQIARDVREALSRTPQRELPAQYFYDDVGSALFEAITRIPEYGLTRADERLLRAHAAEIVAKMPSPTVVAELGSGTGRKTRWLLEALAQREYALYYPIDVSGAALQECTLELAPIDSVRVTGIEASYLDGLREVAMRRSRGEALLLLFLGSTIGNFDRPSCQRFLCDVRRHLQPGDAMLLGTDLVKPVSRLLDAYDDPAGITAAFNLNLLSRLNRELGGNFDLRRFRHEVRYNAVHRRIEMHLRSTAEQHVTIQAIGLEFTLRQGETIWTESSHKFTPEDIDELAEGAGYRRSAQWIDEEWPFAESLLAVE